MKLYKALFMTSAVMVVAACAPKVAEQPPTTSLPAMADPTTF